MPKGENFTAADPIRKILSEIVARREVERGEKRLVAYADNARSDIANVTRAFCDDNFLLIAPHSPDLPGLIPPDLIVCPGWLSQKPPSRTAIHACR
jgi:hypothetical protein